MDDEDSFISFNLICPECGVGNPEGAEYCLVCGRDLQETILFMEDDPF
ncbi:MAG: zinc-ribbon domain-containing protein [Methanobacterium sp.]